ncbi:MAG: PTS sugar transporter subunit IIA [Nitrospinota bacterium]|jgi:PTS system nitrogen regulatory IIA component|nr:PTS sugar transporter subunit IIA [Nitrospinota bacterium]HJN02715.1 PTS sugar transporter subunit IIA [Nitrospinota bacterium]
MKINEILTLETILAEVKANNKENSIEELAEFLCQNRAIADKSELVRVLLEREKLGSTGIGENVAIPHAKMKGLNQIIAAFGISKNGVEFDSLDQKPVNFIFVLLAPENATGTHLKALARISRLLKNQELKSNLLKASNREDIYNIILNEDSKFQ